MFLQKDYQLKSLEILCFFAFFHFVRIFKFLLFYYTFSMNLWICEFEMSGEIHRFFMPDAHEMAQKSKKVFNVKSKHYLRECVQKLKQFVWSLCQPVRF